MNNKSHIPLPIFINVYLGFNGQNGNKQLGILLIG